MKEDFFQNQKLLPAVVSIQSPSPPFPLQMQAEGKKLAGNSGSLRQEEGSQDVRAGRREGPSLMEFAWW